MDKFLSWLIEDRFGNDSSALYFDGTNDFVKIPLSGANSNLFEDDITVSLWVKRYGNGTGTPRIIHNEDSRFWMFDHSGGNRFTVQHIEQMEFRQDNGWNYLDGNWTHIAFTSTRGFERDGPGYNGIMNIYVDGIKVREYSGWVNNNNYPLKENIYIEALQEVVTSSMVLLMMLEYMMNIYLQLLIEKYMKWSPREEG